MNQPLIDKSIFIPKNNENFKGLGFLPVILVLVFLILLSWFCIGYLYWKNHQLQKRISQTVHGGLNTIIGITPKKIPTPTLTPIPKQIMSYNFPPDWKLVKTVSGDFEMGYHPAFMKVSSRKTSSISFQILTMDTPLEFIDFVTVSKIDNKDTLHNLLQRELALIPTSAYKNDTPRYREDEYIYGNMPCLLIHGNTLGSRTTITGACILDRTTAILVKGYAGQVDVEELLRTLKVNKPSGALVKPLSITPFASPTSREYWKEISIDGKVILSIDNDVIFSWFSGSGRSMLYKNKTDFLSQAYFASYETSPDKMKVGFEISTKEWPSDYVVGIYNISTNSINLLTDYYLGNQFISFSPIGTNFAYNSGCFEGLCGLFIMDSETLKLKASINNPEIGYDARGYNTTFIRWITDNQVEYKVGDEIKRESF